MQGLGDLVGEEGEWKKDGKEIKIRKESWRMSRMNRTLNPEDVGSQPRKAHSLKKAEGGNIEMRQEGIENASRNIGSFVKGNLGANSTSYPNPISDRPNKGPGQKRRESLPHIDHRKAGTFLENWLDEALHQANSQNEQIKAQHSNAEEHFHWLFEQHKKVGMGPLHNVHEYELDRLHLQSQNIPAQVVDNIYRNLYIYTYGLDHLFKSVLHSFKNSEGLRNKLLDSVWRAYTKLMENCTSYKDTFQIIEQKHMNALKDAKEYTLKLQALNQAEKKSQKDRIRELQLQRDIKIKQLEQLKSDYRALKANYESTEEGFNQEVALRLKFEEKINAVYLSYNEIKIKFEKICEQFNISKESLFESQNQQSQLRKTLNDANIKLEACKDAIELQQAKLRERNLEIATKMQELEDLQMGQHIQKDQDQQKEQYMAHFSNRFKLVQLQLKEAQTRLAQAQNQTKTSEARIVELLARLEECRALQSSHLVSASQLQKKLTATEEYSAKLESQVNLFMLQIGTLKSELNNSAEQITITRKKAQELLEEHLTLELNYEQLKETIEKNSKVIIDLHSAKDKYERIMDILRKEKEHFEKQINQNMQLMLVKEEEIGSLKSLLSTREKNIEELKVNLEKERHLLNRRNQTLRDQLQKKDEQVTKMSIREQQVKDQLSKKQYRVDSLEQVILLKSAELESARSQLESNHNKIKLLNAEIQKLEEEVQSSGRLLGEQHKELSGLNMEIESKAFVIETQKSERSTELQFLINISDQYKQKLHAKAEYIHPMVYEDNLSRFYMAQLRIAELEVLLSQSQSLQSQAVTLAKMRQDAFLRSEKEKGLLGTQTAALKKNNSNLKIQLSDLEAEFKAQKAKTHIKMNEIQSQRAKAIKKSTELQGALNALELERGRLAAECKAKDKELHRIEEENGQLKRDNQAIAERTIKSSLKRPNSQSKETQTEVIEVKPELAVPLDLRCESVGVQTEQEEIGFEEHKYLGSVFGKDTTEDPMSPRQIEKKKIANKDFRRAFRSVLSRPL